MKGKQSSESLDLSCWTAVKSAIVLLAVRQCYRPFLTGQANASPWRNQFMMA